MIGSRSSSSAREARLSLPPRTYPSATDIRQAWDGLVYVIVSLADFRKPVVKAYMITDGEVAEQPIEVV